MNNAYLLIGGNMGQVKVNLALAKSAIEERVGVIMGTSSLYQTAAWGVKDQPDFLNQVLWVDTQWPATTVLKIVLTIENELGRVRKEKNGPRVIDIDLLLYNDQIINLPELKVPHPRLHTRNFTLFPLAELAPGLKHPVLGKTMQQLLDQSPDDLEVKRLSGD